MREPFNQALFVAADEIAKEHIKRGWFESDVSRLVRHIRLRTDIYQALLANPQGERK